MIIVNIENLSYMKFFKSVSKKITLKIINPISVCLQPFMGFQEPSSLGTDLKKATNLVVWFECRARI